jgi:hypothetical protein
VPDAEQRETIRRLCTSFGTRFLRTTRPAPTGGVVSCVRTGFGGPVREEPLRCPDVDANPCTRDVCEPRYGRCAVVEAMNTQQIKGCGLDDRGESLVEKGGCREQRCSRGATGRLFCGSFVRPEFPPRSTDERFWCQGAQGCASARCNRMSYTCEVAGDDRFCRDRRIPGQAPCTESRCDTDRPRTDLVDSRAHRFEFTTNYCTLPEPNDALCPDQPPCYVGSCRVDLGRREL